MGFTIYYRTLEAIEPEKEEAIKIAARELSEGRTWLSCEPVIFFSDEERLFGGSKPNFDPHPDDVASASAEGLPDGTVSDLLEVLCEISRSHDVDWEIRHDYDPSPIGFIRGGVADGNVVGQIEAFAGIGEIFGDMSDELDLEDEPSSGQADAEGTVDDDDDDGFPPTIKMWSE